MWLPGTARSDDCKDLPNVFFQRVPRKTGCRNRRRDHRWWPRPFDPPRERAVARRVVHPGRHVGAWRNVEQGVARELLEETGIGVRVLELIEVFDRIYAEDGKIAEQAQNKPRFHYVIVDYLCERIAGEPRAGSDVTDV